MLRLRLLFVTTFQGVLDHISLLPVPHDSRCGCVFCPDCSCTVVKARPGYRPHSLSSGGEEHRINFMRLLSRREEGKGVPALYVSAPQNNHGLMMEVLLASGVSR